MNTTGNADYDHSTLHIEDDGVGFDNSGVEVEQCKR